MGHVTPSLNNWVYKRLRSIIYGESKLWNATEWKKWGRGKNINCQNEDGELKFPEGLRATRAMQDVMELQSTEVMKVTCG